MNVPQLKSVPIPPPVEDWPGNLRDVIDTQQQTIKFLLGQWEQLLHNVGIGTGAFGPPTMIAVGAKIPSGWWQTITPNTADMVIGTVPIGPPPTPVTVDVRTGQFWSDGNITVTAAGGVTLARVGDMGA